MGECLPGTGILDSLPPSGPLAPFQPAALVPVILVDNIWYGIGDLRAHYSLPLPFGSMDCLVLFFPFCLWLRAIAGLEL